MGKRFLITPDLDLAENQVRAKEKLGVSWALLWVPYGPPLQAPRPCPHSLVYWAPLTRLIYIAMFEPAFFLPLRAALGPLPGV